MSVSAMHRAGVQHPNVNIPQIQIRERTHIQPFAVPETISTYGTAAGVRETRAQQLARLMEYNPERSSQSLMAHSGYKLASEYKILPESATEKKFGRGITDIADGVDGEFEITNPQARAYTAAIAGDTGRYRVPSSLSSNAQVLPFKSGRASKFIYTNEPKEVPQGRAIVQISTGFNRL
jgi:hypothetical protein